VPIGFLSDAERERLDGFPAQVVPGDLETYFTLSRADRRQVPRTTSAANRLGFALQLGALRFLGFCPDDLTTAPEAVVAFVAKQIDAPPGELARYGRRGQTRTEHLRLIRRYLRFRKAAPWSTTAPRDCCAWPASICGNFASNGRGSPTWSASSPRADGEPSRRPTDGWGRS
jgi:hypothetical protein